MKQALTAILFIASAVTAAHAQVTPVGLWRNIDDKTGEAKAEIRIVEAAGALSGRIEKRLTRDAKADDKCDECTDDRKGQLILGLEIIRGARKAEGKDVWEGGKKLEVRGSFGPFGRTQTWQRVQ